MDTSVAACLTDRYSERNERQMKRKAALVAKIQNHTCHRSMSVSAVRVGNDCSLRNANLS